MGNLPLVKEFGCGIDDNRVVFPMFNRTGEDLVIIPRDKFEVVSSTPNSIILRLRSEDGKERGDLSLT